MSTRTYTLDRNKVSGAAAPEGAGAALCVQVALNVPRLQTLTYRVPETLRERLVPGMRVMVPLGRRRMTAYVVEPPGRVPVDGMALRDVIAVLEDEPALTEELIGLTQWVAEYYCCGWGEAIRAALPGVKERKSVERIRLTETGRREAALEAAGLGLPGLEGKGGSLKARILNGLKGPARRMDTLASAAGRGARPEIERLIEAGLIEKVSADEGGSAPKRIRHVRLVSRPEGAAFEKLKKRAPKQAAVLEMLENADGCRLPLREIEARAPGSRAACAAMAKKGWLAFEVPEGAVPTHLVYGFTGYVTVDMLQAGLSE